MMRRAGIAAATILVALAICGSINAQSPPANYQVVSVEVEGNRIATKSLILGVSSIHLGSPLSQSAIQETMERLYGLGIFRDVEILAEEVTGGLKVIIRVDELPKLGGLEIVGNDKIDTKKIKEKLRLGVGGYISPYLIHEKQQEIKEMYAKEGYFQAEATPELTYNEDSTSATLTYTINEKSKVKVEKVVMTGNERVEADALIGKMRNRKRGFLKSSDFAQEEYDEDLEKVIAEYHKRGFIDAYLISDSMTIDEERNRMTIYLEVYEGPLYYFGEVSFEGVESLPEGALRDKLKYEPGEVFNQEKYEESLFELYSLYQEIGHLHARILDQRTTRNDSLIDITYEINEGVPSNVRLVKIVGNNKTKDKVIRRELKIYPGQRFNRSRIMRSIRDVMALNYFANVEPVPIDLPSGDVDLEFRVEEKQTGQVSAGAGYNSQDKLVGSVGMGIPNLGGNGQNLSFNVDFGSRRNSFNVSFTEPYLFGRPTLFGADLFLLNRRWFDDYTEGRQGGSIRLGKRLTWPDNYFRVFTSYRWERNRFFDFDDSYIRANSRTRDEFWWTEQTDDQGNFVRYTTDSVRITPIEPFPGTPLDYGEEWNAASRWSITLTRDSRNLPEFATSGSEVSYTFSQTGGPMGGFWNYQKHQVSLAKFIPLFWKFAIAAKVEFGAITAPEGDARILLSDRFTPGGTAFDGIVRGYDDGDLTPDTAVIFLDTNYIYLNEFDGSQQPEDADSLQISGDTINARVRGNFMIVSNIELQFPIAERSIYGLLFFDAGNSWLNFDDIKPISFLYKSVGIGFRVVVPGIGTIGFDFGYPLDEPPDGSARGWKPHFQIGTTFR